MTRRILIAAIAMTGVMVMAPSVEAATTRAKVIRVVNGDTVRVSAGGAARTVRLLGVDAPATGECFGANAAAALRRFLPRGAAIRLAKDGRQRGLYVERAGKLVNQAMLAGGFATTERIAGLRRRNRLSAAEARAKAAELGLWGACAARRVQSPAAPPAAAPPTTVATARDQLTSALADSVLRHFDNSTGGCQAGCIQTEEALEYCSDGRFSYDFKSVAQVVLPDPIEPEQRHEEGTWRVLDATAQPDGTLTGTVEVTLQRGTSIDSGQATPGTVETQPISLTADGRTLIGGERWLREASQACA
jgi:micrococcal nuclease